MKKIQIRKSIFETNSSSTHSIVIDNITKLDANELNALKINENGIIEIGGIDNPCETKFEWDECIYSYAATKAMYCHIYAYGDKNLMSMLRNVILEHTRAKDVVFYYNPNSDYDKSGYGNIDHQSSRSEGGAADEAFESKEKLNNFIFNENSKLYTDNDNH